MKRIAQLDIAAANATRMRAQLVKAQETTRDYAGLRGTRALGGSGVENEGS